VLEEIARPPATAAGAVRPAHARSRQRAAHTGNSVIMKSVKILWCAAPIADVCFVPGFPVPRFHFGFSVTLNAVFRPLISQLTPFGVIFRRISPTSKDPVV